MLSYERRTMLLDQLRENGPLKVSELVGVLGVSRVTVLKDIESLVDAGLAVRFHGGVALAAGGPDGASGLAGYTGSTTRTRRFGVLLPEGGYFRDVLEGVTEASARVGAQTALVLSRYDQERDLAAIEALVRDRVDGLLLVCPADDSGHALFAERIRSLPLPVVLIERRLDDEVLVDRLDHVVSDHDAGGRIAVEHLASIGHRRIGLVTKDVGPTAPRVRAGFERALRLLGLDADAQVFTVPQLAEDDTVDQQLAEAVAQLKGSGVTAVVAHGDREAVLLCQLAQAAGLRIPQDLAIVSYDDDMAAFASIPLTAIAPAKRDLGAEAVRLLVDRLRNDGDAPVRHVVVQPRLVVRESCGAGRRGGRRGGPRVPGRF